MIKIIEPHEYWWMVKSIAPVLSIIFTRFQLLFPLFSLFLKFKSKKSSFTSLNEPTTTTSLINTINFWRRRRGLVFRLEFLDFGFYFYFFCSSLRFWVFVFSFQILEFGAKENLPKLLVNTWRFGIKGKAKGTKEEDFLFYFIKKREKKKRGIFILFFFRLFFFVVLYFWTLNFGLWDILLFLSPTEG